MNSEDQSGALTIEQLEQEAVPAPDWSPGLLRLHTKPIDALTHEEMRLAIVNEWALPHLIPLALDILENAPATGYGFGSRTLLGGVLGAAPSFCAAHPDWWARAKRILRREADAYMKLLHAQMKLPSAEFSALAAAREAELWERLENRYLTNVAADGSDKVIRLSR